MEGDNPYALRLLESIMSHSLWNEMRTSPDSAMSPRAATRRCTIHRTHQSILPFISLWDRTRVFLHETRVQLLVSLLQTQGFTRAVFPNLCDVADPL